MVWSLSLGSVGKIGAYIALESWLFRFWPCSGQGQLTTNGLISNSAEILDGKLNRNICSDSNCIHNLKIMINLFAGSMQMD